MCRATPSSFAAARVTAHRPRGVTPRHPRASRIRCVPVRLLGRLTLVLVLDALALLALSELLSGFTLGGPLAALGLAAVLGVANAVVWPVLLRFALPFTVLTLGLGALVLNAACCWAPRGCSTTCEIDGLFEAVVVTLGLTADHDDRRRRARARPRRPLVPPHRRPPGQARQAGRADRRPRARVPRDRRPRARRAAARAARRQRARARALDARRRLPPPALGDRLVLADRRLPGRACCTAPTTTCPPSAGGRRTPAARSSPTTRATPPRSSAAAPTAAACSTPTARAARTSSPATRRTAC